MKLIKNTGNDRVMDALRAGLTPAAKLDIATPAFSVFAFAEFAAQLQNLSACRLVLPDSSQTDLQLLGSDADRAFRNQLTARWLARQCADWISNRVEVRNTQTTLPQSSLIATDADATLSRAITGHCPFTTDGLGLTPGNPLSLIQCSETPDECATLQTWFTKLWESLPASPASKQNLLAQLATITDGILEIDSNGIENSIRPSALGKRNWMFIGHPEADERSAIIHTLLGSCRRHGINPFDCLQDLFTRLPAAKITGIKEFTPAAWATRKTVRSISLSHPR